MSLGTPPAFNKPPYDIAAQYQSAPWHVIVHSMGNTHKYRQQRIRE